MICTYVSVFICMRPLFTLHVPCYAIYVSINNKWPITLLLKSCWTLGEQDMMTLIIMSPRVIERQNISGKFERNLHR